VCADWVSWMVVYVAGLAFSVCVCVCVDGDGCLAIAHGKGWNVKWDEAIQLFLSEVEAE